MTVHSGQRFARRLLLVSLMGAAIVVVPGGFGIGSDAPPTPPSEPANGSADGPASVSPPVAGTTPARPVTTPLETPRSADPPPARPTDRPMIDPQPSAPPIAPTMAAAAPVRLQIPSIEVDTDLMELGLQTDGTLEVPPDGFPAGWYTGAPTPGELGPAIIAGHVDWGGQPGVFFDLRELSSGEEITIVRYDGSTARFRVTRVERFAKEAFPTQAVYGDLDHAGLRLITCGGSFDRESRSYQDNLVVFAELLHDDEDRPADVGPGHR